MVERHLAKVQVAGSTPVSRSTKKDRRACFNRRAGLLRWRLINALHSSGYHSYAGLQLKIGRRAPDPDLDRVVLDDKALLGRIPIGKLARG